jgi:chemotaxis protein histidine kinase CheA
MDEARRQAHITALDGRVEIDSVQGHGMSGQQQVVVKKLEANYRRVPDVSGATIMGDCRVALFPDVGALARRTRHKYSRRRSDSNRSPMCRHFRLKPARPTPKLRSRRWTEGPRCRT